MSVGSLLDENSTVALLLDYERDTTAAVCSAYALPKSPEDAYLASLYLSVCDSPLVSSLVALQCSLCCAALQRHLHLQVSDGLHILPSTEHGAILD